MISPVTSLLLFLALIPVTLQFDYYDYDEFIVGVDNEEYQRGGGRGRGGERSALRVKASGPFSRRRRQRHFRRHHDAHSYYQVQSGREVDDEIVGKNGETEISSGKRFKDTHDQNYILIHGLLVFAVVAVFVPVSNS